MGKLKKLREEITISVMNKLQEVYKELDMPATDKSLKKNKKLAQKVAKNLAVEKQKTDRKISKELTEKVEENGEAALLKDGKATTQKNTKADAGQETDDKKPANNLNGKENKQRTSTAKPKTQKRSPRKKPAGKVK